MCTIFRTALISTDIACCKIILANSLGLSYYHNTISDRNEASFPPKSGNEAFDPYSDPDCENSLWKQWRERR